MRYKRLIASDILSTWNKPNGGSPNIHSLRLSTTGNYEGCLYIAKLQTREYFGDSYKENIFITDTLMLNRSDTLIQIRYPEDTLKLFHHYHRLK